MDLNYYFVTLHQRMIKKISNILLFFNLLHIILLAIIDGQVYFYHFSSNKPVAKSKILCVLRTPSYGKISCVVVTIM